MIGNLFCSLVSSLLASLAAAAGALWPAGTLSGPMTGIANWFAALEDWVPWSAFGAQVVILVVLVTFTQALKWGRYVINLVRGAGS